MCNYHMYTAMKIQCSDTTYQLLNKLGNFHLERRGNIDIKVAIITWACPLRKAVLIDIE